MRSAFFCLLLLLGITGSAQAQQSISGTVSSSAGEALAGVAVRIRPGGATHTDSLGYYTLPVPVGGTAIRIYRQGYVARSVALDSTETEYNILLDPAEFATGEVETALGVVRTERSLSYPVSQLTGEDLTRTNENNLVALLSGRAPGVQVNANNSGPGGSAHLLLRGAASLAGNQQPLIVVDGVPFANDHNNTPDAIVAARGRDYGTTAADINPADIATVSVLRGGAAVALYGSRASNGVIMVTTKQGTPRQGLGVSLTSGVAFSNVSVLPDYQNQYGGGTRQQFDVFEYKAGKHPASWASFDGQLMPEYSSDQSWGPALEGQEVRHWDSWYPGAEFGKLRPWSPQPDNVSDFYGTGISLDNSLAFSGGSDRGTYRLSLTNSTNSGVYPEHKLGRNTVHANVQRSITKRLSARFRGAFVHTKGQGRPAIGLGGFGDPVNVQTSFNQWFQRQLDVNRLKEYEQEEGSYRTWNIYSPENLQPFYWESPYWSIHQNPNTDTRTRAYGNLELSYEVLPGLSVMGYARADAYNFDVSDRITAFSTAHIAFRTITEVERRDRNLGGVATFSRDLGKDLHVALRAGTNFRRDRYNNLRRKISDGLDLPGRDTLNLWYIDSTRTEVARNRDVNSVFGQLSASWKQLLYVDVSARQDYTSALNEGYNATLSPGVSLGFVFSDLLRHPVLSFGKLRFGVSTVANDPAPFRTRQAYMVGDPYGERNTTTVPELQANAGLVAERVTTTEVGLDLRLFNERVGIDLSHYRSESTDLLLMQQTSGASGFYNVRSNEGLLTNTGSEVSVLLTPFLSNSFRWDLRVSAGTNENRIVELSEGQESITIDDYGTRFVAATGQPFGTLVGTGYVRDAAGRITVDAQGLPLVAEDLNLGSVFPDLTGGLSSTWRVRNLRIGALLDVRRGGVVYSASNAWGSYSGQLASTVGTNANGVDVRQPVEAGGGILVDGVTADGSENTIYVPAQDYYYHQLGIDEAYVYDASFVKLRELSLGYDLPKRWFGNGGIDGAGISLFARNVATLYKNVPSIDPETAVTNAGIQGFENGQTPTVRTIGFKAHVAF